MYECILCVNERAPNVWLLAKASICNTRCKAQCPFLSHPAGSSSCLRENASICLLSRPPPSSFFPLSVPISLTVKVARDTRNATVNVTLVSPVRLGCLNRQDKPELSRSSNTIQLVTCLSPPFTNNRQVLLLPMGYTETSNNKKINEMEKTWKAQRPLWNLEKEPIVF